MSFFTLLCGLSLEGFKGVVYDQLEKGGVLPRFGSAPSSVHGGCRPLLVSWAVRCAHNAEPAAAWTRRPPPAESGLCPSTAPHPSPPCCALHPLRRPYRVPRQRMGRRSCWAVGVARSTPCSPLRCCWAGRHATTCAPRSLLLCSCAAQLLGCAVRRERNRYATRGPATGHHGAAHATQRARPRARCGPHAVREPSPVRLLARRSWPEPLGVAPGHRRRA